MKRFMNSVRSIPPVTWPVALLLGGLSAYLMIHFAPNGPDIGKWPTIGVVWFGILVLYEFISVLLSGYIYIDAARRGMRNVTWMLLAFFVYGGIGFILYFVLREPLPVHCPKCNTTARSGFIFCPQCGTELAVSCPECKRAVEPDWKRCVYCGVKLDWTADSQNTAAFPERG
jgi:hypothetical protein